MKTALVVAAHPDDEVLGCGGTIARLSDEGWAVHVLIFAEGATSRSYTHGYYTSDCNGEFISTRFHTGAVSELAECAKAANDILGVLKLRLLSLPDNRLDGIELLNIVKLVEVEIDLYKPDLVLTHHAGDVNIDHRVLHDAVIAACRPQPGHSVKTLLFFEIPSSTEWRPAASGMPFTPNYFYDVSVYMPKKIEALNVYKSEMRKFPHPRSIEAVENLAHWRGATVGCVAAEAFMLGRSII